MARIRVASTVGGTENDRAIGVLSKWAFNYMDTKNRHTRHIQHTAEVLIEKTHARQLAAREKVFERNIPFSWTRFFIGLVSLLLVFSDIFRGGLGVHKLETYYPALHPDEVLGFGTSWNYSVFAATRSEAANMTALVWTYKFDSTSISWRAFASYLAVKAFPECFFYVESCANKSINGDVAFHMIDALVDAIANVNNTKRVRHGPVGLTLRTENVYIDRLHQFLLPAWFTNINWRTNQALHYSADLLAKISARNICFPPNGHRVRCPRFCQELWINLDRSCAPTDAMCRAAGLLYVHTMRRLHDIQIHFPHLSLDLTFLKSQEDMQVNRGGLSSVGFGRSDVSTIIRARNCSSEGLISCETMFIDEYRYETGLLTADVVQWYRLVAALRITGQSYFWLRGIGLMLSCFFVFGDPTTESSSSMWIQLRQAHRLFMKIPTQCVVYGSPFPITCYVLAHLIDAPYTYQVLESQFFSQAGVVNIKLEAFISYAVVQMRSVWVYALTWQIMVSLTKSSGLAHVNQLNSGIIGVPEFLLTAFSGVTLLAQYRIASIRSANVLKTIVFPGNVGPAWEAVKYQYGFSHRGRGNRSLGGMVIDFKFLICLLFLVAALWVVHITRPYVRKEDKHRYYHWFLLPPTPVPYSAGFLWPSVSMCVHWSSDFYCIRDDRNLEPELLQIVKKKQYRLRRPWLSRLLWWRTGDARVLALNFSSFPSQSKYTPEAELRVQARAKRKQADTFRYIQHQIECMHCRSDHVEANVAFINAVLLSDPLVYLRIICGGNPSTELAYYQSVWHPRQVLLLPSAVVGDTMDTRMD